MEKVAKMISKSDRTKEMVLGDTSPVYFAVSGPILPGGYEANSEGQMVWIGPSPCPELLTGGEADTCDWMTQELPTPCEP